jgi:hypothetical protein
LVRPRPDIHEKALFRHSSDRHFADAQEVYARRLSLTEEEMGRILLAIAAGVLTLPGGLSAAPVYTGHPMDYWAISAQEFTFEAISHPGWNFVTDNDGMAPVTLPEEKAQASPEGLLNDPVATPEPETAMLCGAALLTLGLLARRYLPKARR